MTEPGQTMRIDELYVIIKLVERCNLNCSYCYYYTQENAEVFSRASLMSDQTLDDIIGYVHAAATKEPIRQVIFGFHGGEPTLAKAPRVRAFCENARRRLESITKIFFVMQTNGVHVSDEWLQLMEDERMGVGISIDGTQQTHDRYRVDHKGNGSYERVCQTLRKLLPIEQAGHIRLTALAVMGADFTGLDFYRHLVDELGIRHLKILFPDRTSDMEPPQKELEQLGEMLCEIFDYWLLHDRDRVSIVFFESVIRGLILARRKRGNGDGVVLGLAVLSDGRIRVQDDYMITSQWFWSQRELFVNQSELRDYLGQPHLQQIVHQTTHEPAACASCAYAKSCAGGEVAHRYKRVDGFDHRSIYCAALFKLYQHVENRLALGESELARQNISRPFPVHATS
jgi:uncharacterized protein